MSIPLRGQGMPLPPEWPYAGAWLLQDVLFLYRPSQKFPSQHEEFTAWFHQPFGKWCSGFASSVLAQCLGISVDELFFANAAGKLLLEEVQEISLPHGGAAKRYTFKLGKKVCSIDTVASEFE